MFSRAEYMKDIKKIVIKVGSSTLTYSNGLLNLSQMEMIVRQLSDIHNRGIDVVLVSSGAIAAGIGKLGLKARPKTMPQKQAAAAVGQGILMQMYEKIFSEYGKTVGQILLTKDDMEHKDRYTNAKNAFSALIQQGVISIVNENDAVITDEIKFGDNDTLSAHVASLVKADLLIIMSDIDGMYDSNPRENPEARLLSCIENITPEIESAAGGAGSSLGTGGMATKVKAAKIAISAGCSMIIVKGSSNNILRDILDGKEIGTLFKA